MQRQNQERTGEPTDSANEITIEMLERAGGALWERNGMRRVYFNDLPTLFGRLKCGFYNTGHVSSAALDGEKISNTRASSILAVLNCGKFWYDMSDSRFHFKSSCTCRDLDGGEIIHALVASVRGRMSNLQEVQNATS